MTLIKSISGIRGTIGGKAGDNLTPVDIINFTTAYGIWVKSQAKKEKYTVIVGRDARISGQMVHSLVSGALMGIGINVTDIGLATTPTTEVAVTAENADGGIILTASHNPKQWNALKLLNNKGEFVSAADGATILDIAANINKIDFTEVDMIGKLTEKNNYNQYHIDLIKKLPLVDVEAIKKANFTIAIDCVNSVGGTAIPHLLKELGVNNVIELYCTPNGDFPHNPEPLPENLRELSDAVIKHKAHAGFAVDPDVDRLAIISEDGSMFGEEYTLVAVSDYILTHKKGNTVSNLSSSRALRVVTEKHGGQYFSAAVGELNVVEQMKKCNAVIGGEGNGGVIYPDIHYGRDALVGIALFLTHLAKTGLSCSALRKTYPNYFISKNKIELTPGIDVDKILDKIRNNYEAKNVKVLTIDGVKLEFENEWVHLRKSNTEPIIRIYAESNTESSANELAQKLLNEIKSIT